MVSERARAAQRSAPSSLGDALLQRGLVTAEVLRRAQAIAQNQRRELGEILLESGALSSEQLLEVLGDIHGVPTIDLHRTSFDPMVLDAIPRERARDLRALPLFLVGNQLTVAIPDPQNLAKLDELRFLTGKEILPVLGLAADIGRHLDELYGPAGFSEEAELEVVSSEGAAQDDSVSLEEAEADRPIVRVVNLIISRAVDEGASDIHFEPEEGGMSVRYRIDGRLRPKPFQLPKVAVPAVVSRIKILSNLDISERRRPQDGKIRVRLRGRRVDIRTSTCPNIHGEKVVLRLLDKEKQDFTLDRLGMDEDLMERWKRMLLNREGIVLVTGPTGSGKSSTLYATLRHLHDPEVNIVTLEDPVEYELAGISQSQVNERAGFTFASGLRSLLRQDPDIILVGEIRDQETAQIAVQAALTGHLVLATLHTNDAPSAVVRLVDMGLQPFLVGASLIGVLAQRLVRRVCPECRRVVAPTPDERLVFGRWLDGALPFEDGAGCRECGDAGYRGRTGVHELLTVDRTLQRIISNGGTDADIADHAVSTGYRPMWQDGLEKVNSGATTLRELARGLGLPEDGTAAATDPAATREPYDADPAPNGSGASAGGVPER